MSGYLERSDVLSWGRVDRHPQRIAAPRFADELPGLVGKRPDGGVLAIGRCRSYGDTVRNRDGGLIQTTYLDRFLSFDSSTGVLRAEAGCTLDDILLRLVPKGWFVPVTPGTRFVTLGGAVANDVHGKNHHRAGTFGRHVRRLGLLRSDGQNLTVSRDTHPELFSATIGGLGLTGVIDWVEIELQRISSTDLDVEIIPFSRLDEFWTLAEESVSSHEHTVAWIDCTKGGSSLGRGIFSRANWCTDGSLIAHSARSRLGVPLEAPFTVLNRLSVSAFNEAYFRAHTRKAGAHRQPYEKVFYPLDAIANWNRMYGRAGFWQYQCVLPPQTMRAATAALLEIIARSKAASFLSVLKTFGPLRSPGLMSFPMEGVTLALDFPNRGPRTLGLLAELDTVASEAGGRLYPAKDGRMPAAMWTAGYDALQAFMQQVDPAFGSDFWRRVSK